MPEPFSRVTSVAVPLGQPNIDTDQILPARFLKLARADGLGHVAFHDLRFDANRQPSKDFVLNRQEFIGAQILLAGENFGSGSSREAAVYALYDYGIRCVIAPSFAGIFFANSLRNGLLPVRLSATEVQGLNERAEQSPRLSLTVDVEASTVTTDSGETFTFSIPGLQRRCLLSGKEELDLTMEYMEEIHRFMSAREAALPWTRPIAPVGEDARGLAASLKAGRA